LAVSPIVYACKVFEKNNAYRTERIDSSCSACSGGDTGGDRSGGDTVGNSRVGAPGKKIKIKIKVIFN
jgi:hypothetical protein